MVCAQMVTTLTCKLFPLYNTCTYMQIHMAHGRLPLGSTLGAQVVSVCPETADLSDSGLVESVSSVQKL